MKTITSNNHNKIIVLALSGIGDALMFVPTILLIKNKYPDFQIDVLVRNNDIKLIFETMGEINNVIYFDFLGAGYLGSLKFLLSIRNKYDAGINIYPSNRKEYHLINFVINAKRRTGIRYIKDPLLNLIFLNNFLVDESFSTHNVLQNVKIAENVFGRFSENTPSLRINLSKKEEDFANNYLKGKEGKIIIGIHAGCSTFKNHTFRRWPKDNFVSLLKLLLKQSDIQVLLFGDASELELNNQILKNVESDRISIVQAPDILHTAAIINKCDLFVTNDSGLMHVAAALKKKIIAIVGPTNKNFIFPWQTDHKIISKNQECSPCFYYSPTPLQCKHKKSKYSCLTSITPEEVFNEIRGFLN